MTSYHRCIFSSMSPKLKGSTSTKECFTKWYFSSSERKITLMTTDVSWPHASDRNHFRYSQTRESGPKEWCGTIHVAPHVHKIKAFQGRKDNLYETCNSAKEGFTKWYFSRLKGKKDYTNDYWRQLTTCIGPESFQIFTNPPRTGLRSKPISSHSETKQKYNKKHKSTETKPHSQDKKNKEASQQWQSMFQAYCIFRGRYLCQSSRAAGRAKQINTTHESEATRKKQ